LADLASRPSAKGGCFHHHHRGYLPVIIWVWMVKDVGVAALITVYLLPVGFSDNALKPLLIGRGLSTPVLVIFMGVLGGGRSRMESSAVCRSDHPGGCMGIADGLEPRRPGRRPPAGSREREVEALT
jgi:hypothetical protein